MKLASIRTRVAVGGFILIVAALAIVFVFISKDSDSFFNKHQSFRIVFTDATGLQVGAPVRMAGLSIGEVKSLALTFKENKEAIDCVIEIQEPHYDMIREGAEASLQTAGVLGDRFVAISGGSSQAKKIGEGQIIKAADQVTMDEVLDRTNTVIENMAVVSEKFRIFAEKLEENVAFSEVMTNMANTGKNLGAITQILADPNGTIAYLNHPSTKQSIERGLTQLETSTALVESIGRKIDSGEGTIGMLVNDPSIYNGMQSAMGQSNRKQLVKNAVYDVSFDHRHFDAH